ncbi:hypothetical protein JW898_01350 [Candidatus Woesearchaeota archaeon]|nr:hypothetical protein [Candidatus Woesearchaeota archaeon]
MSSSKPSLIDSIITDIEESRLLRLVASSFRAWYTNWPWILLSVLVDFLFLISVGVIITLIQFTLLEHLEALMTMAGEATGGLMNIYNDSAAVASGMGIVQGMDFQYHLGIIFKYLAIMIISSFALWLVFQGISWYIAYRMSSGPKHRLSFLVFWKNFALESLPFYLLSIVWIFLSIRVLFAIKISMVPLMSEGTLNFLFVLMILITWYFGTLCYTLARRDAWQNFRQCFVYGIMRFPKVIQSFLFMAVLFIVIDLFLRIGFIRSDPFVLMVIGTILFMPAVVFARILLFRTAQEYWDKR